MRTKTTFMGVVWAVVFGFAMWVAIFVAVAPMVGLHSSPPICDRPGHC